MKRWGPAFWRHFGRGFPTACGHLPVAVKTGMLLLYEDRELNACSKLLWKKNMTFCWTVRWTKEVKGAVKLNVHDASFLQLLTGDQQVYRFFYQDWETTAPSTQPSSHMELRGTRGPTGGQDLRGQGLGFSLSATGMPASSIITAVRQQDYSASVWLRRRDKLEHVSFEYWSWGRRNRWKEAEMPRQKAGS